MSDDATLVFTLIPAATPGIFTAKCWHMRQNRACSDHSSFREVTGIRQTRDLAYGLPIRADVQRRGNSDGWQTFVTHERHVYEFAKVAREGVSAYGYNKGIHYSGWFRVEAGEIVSMTRADVVGSPHLYFDTAEQAFRWTLRVGGRPARDAAITPATGRGTATRSPFVVLDEGYSGS